MADDDTQSAAQSDEQDFAIPGQQDDAGALGGAEAPPAAPPPATAAPSATAGPSAQAPAAPMTESETWEAHKSDQPSGRAMFLGSLLKTILSGAVAGVGSSGSKFGNAVRAGQQATDPIAQQLKQSTVDKAMSDADQAKIQTSITGMKALQSEYLLKRLPQDDQMKHLQAVSAFKQNLIKEGANVEAEGDDEKASDAQAMHLNGTDPRALNHSGRFYSLPTMDSDGKPKFDTVYVPNKETLQEDYTYTDTNGKEQTIPAGTPMAGAMGKFVENMQKNLQDETQAQHKQMGDALKPNVPDAVIPQTIGFLKDQQKQNTPLYQQNKAAVDARIDSLQAAHDKIQSDKAASDALKGAQKTEESGARKDTSTFGYGVAKNGELQYMSRAEANENHSTFQQMSPADVNKDRISLRQLNDVQMNVSKYDNAISAMDKNIEHTDAMHRIIAGVSEADVEKAGYVTLAAGMSMMEQSEVKDSWNKLDDKERNLMIGYLRAKGAIIAYNRALTGSARANKESLMIEMANLPTPDLGAKVGRPQLDSFQENIDQAASGYPTNLPGMKTPKEVRTEVWREAHQ